MKQTELETQYATHCVVLEGRMQYFHVTYWNGMDIFFPYLSLYFFF